MQIKSPKATRVIEVLETNAPVEKGQVLLRLSDLEENVMLSTICRSLDENAAKLAEVEQEKSTQKLYIELKMIADLLLQAVDNNARSEHILQQEYDQGTETLTNVLLTRKKTLSSHIKWRQAEAERIIHQRNVNDSIMVYGLVKNILNEEHDLVRKYIERLTIKAPFRGTFIRRVEKGSPVELGHVLGEFT